MNTAFLSLLAAAVSPPASKNALPTNVLAQSASQGHHRHSRRPGSKKCPALAELVPCTAKDGSRASALNASNVCSSKASDCPTVACSACRRGRPARFHAKHRAPRGVKHGGKQIYLIVACPPYSSSSGLEGLLATAPGLSTMCKKGTWECETTSVLQDHGIFPEGEDSRWDPSGTDWDRAYDIFEREHMWDDPTAPVLLDKSPPNLAKSRSLVRFFERKGYEYRFVVLWRHPCLFEPPWRSRSDTPRRPYLDMLNEVLANVPRHKRLVVRATDLATRPDGVARRLLKWLPELRSLDINSTSASFFSNNEQWSSFAGDRALPELQYTTSAACKLHSLGADGRRYSSSLVDPLERDSVSMPVPR